MKYAFFLAMFLSGVTGFGISANARDLNETVSFLEFRTNPDVFEGRMVEVSARVIAISADAKSMELFDSESKAIVRVRLNQMTETARKNLIKGDVRHVSVVGRAIMMNGRVIIDAQKVVAIPGSEVISTTVVN
jgi:hypothetical protein